MRRVLGGGGFVPFLQAERDVFDNPWRGFYTVYRFFAHKPEPLPPLTPGESLCLVEINLCAFPDSDPDEAALRNIQEILSGFAAAGRQMILRFLYDWEGQGLRYEPLDLEQVLSHIRLLGKTLKGLEGFILMHQGLLVGSWGEMHTSRHLHDEGLRLLGEEMLRALPAAVFLAVRSPSQWRLLLRARSLEEAGARGTRVGLFNDAILGSSTDLGTYGSLPRTAARAFGERLERRDELAFQHRLCWAVPNGGEVLGPGGLEVRTAMDTFRQMRVSYLNRNHDPAVLDAYRASPVPGATPAWQKRSAYDYLAAHLGYRYLLGGLSCRRAGERLRLSFTIKNTGTAPAYRPFRLSLAGTLPGGGTFMQALEADNRAWLPGAEASLSAILPRFDTLGLVMRDEALGLDVQVCNLALPRGGVQPLGTLTPARRGFFA